MMMTTMNKSYLPGIVKKRQKHISKSFNGTINSLHFTKKKKEVPAAYELQ